VITHERRSLREGAIGLWGPLGDEAFARLIEAVGQKHGFDLDTPVQRFTPEARTALLYGGDSESLSLPNGLRFRYRGIFPTVEWASRLGWGFRWRLGYLMADVPCPACGGSRLRPDAAAVRFQGKTMQEIAGLPLSQTMDLFDRLDLSDREEQIAGDVLREVRHRLQFLVEVGLEYLTLGRPAPTLSGGETQRIRLASQVGSGLTGVLYVLDEPTIGLHQRDNARLLKALGNLRDLGNSLIVVEHDRGTLESADTIVDFGPGGGPNGGQVVAQGTAQQLSAKRRSLTGKYLSGKLSIPVPTNRRQPGDQWVEVVGARLNNLQDVTARFPCGLFTCVAGVSGSGKTSLLNDTLFPYLARELHRANATPGPCDEIRGLQFVDKVINIDQQPIGWSPRSDPVTYVGAFDPIRRLFTELPEAKLRGYSPNRFSFNRPGGRCDACHGLGHKRIEMQFLADVWVKCEVCDGARYNAETLDVKFHGKSIGDVLTLTVDEAVDLFRNLPQIRRILQTLSDVGLGYLQLGQSAPTLSGGEAQRVKLARQLARPQTGRTIYFLDEPTTGLHLADVQKLLDVLHRLVDAGNTVIVIEHNLEVIKTADWVIDLGPDAGEAGGRIVAEGPPEVVAGVGWLDRRNGKEGRDGTHASHPSYTSHTAPLLRRELERSPHAERRPHDPAAADRAAAQGTTELSVHEVGKQFKRPWETDGRKWHTRDRKTARGEEPHWEGEALGWLVDTLRQVGDFDEPNWNDQRRVSLAGKGAGVQFFLAATRDKCWFTCSFRTAKDEFSGRKLLSDLKLKPWNERPDVPAYGRQPRVKVRKTKSRYDQVVLLLHDRAEVDTPAFRSFLARAAKSYAKMITKEAEKRKRRK